MTGGDPWNEILEEELKNAGVFVVLLSPLWLTSDWCRKELSLYRALGKQQGLERPVVPLLWDKTEPRSAQSEEQAAMLAWINAHQLIAWDTLRHRDSSYQGYREAIGHFAEAVAEKLMGK